MPFQTNRRIEDTVEVNCWSILLIIVWLIYLALIVETDLWNYVGVPHMTPLFADLYAVLSAADCSTLGYDVFKENPCDIYFHPGRVHVYPTLMVSIRKYRFNSKRHFLAGRSTEFRVHFDCNFTT